MNDTESVAIVDTDREELRARIAIMRQRFYRLALAADPLAMPPKSKWTVQQVVAHVLSVAHRYQSFAATGDFRRAASPRDVHQLNEDELEAVMAPIPDLVDQLKALEPVMDTWFDGLPDDFSGEFHFGLMISAPAVQINWLGELILHGEDVARAVGAPWDISERDMLLYLRMAAEVTPAFARAGMDPTIDIRVALRVPGARPFVLHVHDAGLEMRSLRPDDRPDATLKLPASTLVSMLLNRVDPFTAVRRGLRIAGGRRPWRAIQLQSCIETV